FRNPRPAVASNSLTRRLVSQLRRLAMSLPAAWPQVLDIFGAPLVLKPSEGQLSGDAGLLPVRQFDQRIGLTRAFAAALDDPHDPDLTAHTILGDGPQPRWVVATEEAIDRGTNRRFVVTNRTGAVVLPGAAALPRGD